MKATTKFALILMVCFIFTTGNIYAEDQIKFIEEPFSNGRTYSMIYPFKEGRALVRKGDFFTGKWGFIDENGEEVIPCVYDFSYDFSEGLAPVKRDGKGGYVNRDGEIVIPLIYNSVSSFSEGLAAVTNENDFYGYIDREGKLVIPHHFIEAGEFSEGLAHVHGDFYNTPVGRGHIDKNGKIVTPLNHEEVGKFKNGLAFYRKDYKYGFINKDDEIVIPAVYDEIRSFYTVAIPVSIDDKWGLIDTNGDEIIPFTYDYIFGFSEGLSPVLKDGKKGFIDEKGQLVIPLIYDDAGGFHEGICVVAKRDENNILKWGYIDKTGKELTPFIYDYASAVGNGLATISNSMLLRIVRTSAPEKETVQPTEIIANPNKLRVVIDGTEVAIGSYLIDNTSYFKLRDIAYALKSTPKYFDVMWDDQSRSIFLTSGNSYTPVGGEMGEINSTNTAVASNSKLYINNKLQSLDCYTIQGSNYFKLRDLGSSLMFGVDYNNDKKQIEISTGH